MTIQRYPVGENEFGRKGGRRRLRFVKSCLELGKFPRKRQLEFLRFSY